MVRLRDLAPHVEKLATLPVVVPGHSSEHALHELCHAATLGLPFDRFDGFLTKSVGDKLLDMRSLPSDWNEIWTCAAELRAAALLGWDVWTARAILGGNVLVMSPRSAERLITERVWTERAYAYACTAIRGASVAVAAFERAYPWWPGSPPPPTAIE
jgi:hypothetical protein